VSAPAAPSAAWDALVPRLARSPLVVLLDVDGTLAPIAPTPEAAEVPAETRRTVAALAARPAVHVALVSGRSAADARRMVAVDAAWAIGNHGIETIAPGGEVSIDERAAPWRERLANAARALAGQLATIPGVFVEDKTWTLSIHYRNADPAVVPRVREAVRAAAAASGLRATEGKMVLELRPPLAVDKGTASVAFVRRVAPGQGAGVIYIGDDRTDEDAFGALRREVPDAVTVRVAGGNDDAHRTTSAEVLVADVDAVRAILERLVALR
jgi:trehalose-phosphatase